MGTKKVIAKELSGNHIGEHILQSVKDYSGSQYDRETMEWTTPPVITRVWFEINMILHKKDGTVRVRTRQAEAHFMPDSVVELL